MAWMRFGAGLVVIAVGCGPKAGSGGEAGSGSTTTTTATTAITATTTSVDTGTGGGGACDPSDADIGPPVTVRLTNDRDVPIYFTQTVQCEVGSPFSITLDGDPVPWIPGPCTTCGEALQGACQCPVPCFADAVIRVDPGGVWEGQWPGSVAVTAQLTPDCVSEFCGDTCIALEQAAPGSYAVEATAWTDVDCQGMPCACSESPPPDGWCTVTGQVAGDSTPRPVPFDYPDVPVVDLSWG